MQKNPTSALQRYKVTKFDERLKLSPNISNTYQIAGIPQTITCDRVGEEEILPLQLLLSVFQPGVQ